MAASRAVAWALVVACGCAPTRTDAWRSALAAADRAYSAGRFVEASDRYDDAARAATLARDRDEAVFRAASARVRAGDVAGASSRFELVAQRSTDYERGARAALELAELRETSPDPAVSAQGRADLDALVRTRPATGPARVAMLHRLRGLDVEGPDAAVAWIDAVSSDPAVRPSLLWVTLRAERARRLADHGRGAEAEATLDEMLRAVPYPQNTRWDDGHVALARLRRARGDFAGALAALDRMLSVREPSYGNGSYVAPRFIEGAMLRAEILRDDVRDARAAADAFHAVYAGFPTARERDDALWEEATVCEAVDPARACAVWRRLGEEFPCQRRGRDARARWPRCGVTAPPARCP